MDNVIDWWKYIPGTMECNGKDNIDNMLKLQAKCIAENSYRCLCDTKCDRIVPREDIKRKFEEVRDRMLEDGYGTEYIKSEEVDIIDEICSSMYNGQIERMLSDSKKLDLYY